jgi:phosphate transport system substrate-binding protein
MLMKRTLGWLLSWLILAGTGCQQAPEPESQALVVSASPSVAPLLEEIGQRFRERHPGVRVDIDTTASDRAVVDTRQGLADVGVITRSLLPGESGLQVLPLARDGVALFVHKTNPIPSLNNAQIAGLSTRALTYWKEVGGTDQPVVVVNHAEGRPLRILFLEHFGVSARQPVAAPTVVSSAQAIQAVASQPRAIGYGSLGMADSAVREGKPIRLLPLAGVPATPDNVHNGTYPFTRPLNLITRGKPRDLVREFLDFARSSEVHDLINKYGFSPAPP